MIKIAYKDTLDGCNLVLLATETSNFNNYGLSDKEIDCIHAQIKAKIGNISVDKGNYRIFIQVVDIKSAVNKAKENLRRCASKLHRYIAQQKIQALTIVDTIVNPELAYAYVEGLVLSNYQFLKYIGKKGDKQYPLTEVYIAGTAVRQGDIDNLNHVTAAVCKARDLTNEPANFMTPLQLANEVQAMGKEAGFEVQVLDKMAVEKLKMGGILAVNQGSIEPPTFSILEWKPANARNKRPIVLVGKGITYDTGGHCLKPADSMDYMKCDMAGGATVAAVFYAVAKAGIPLHTIGLIPSTDNRLSAGAYSPGDVITMFDGTTVEVMNTDAEGRIILADALSYAKQFDPELVVDIATLTGAAHRAIGEQGMAGMGNAPREVMDRLKECGDSVFERIAEFPFWEEYAESIQSDIADLKNTGGEYAGMITAGKFLEHFTAYPYIHLDIAGLSFLKTTDSYRGKGGTGIGVRLLFEFLKNYQ